MTTGFFACDPVSRPPYGQPLGLDVGGANLKAATADGRAWSEPFALWREPQRLAARLRAIIARFPECGCLAATMTGELADCFETKAAGVCAITRALEEAADGLPLAIWSTAGEFLAAPQARERWADVAAANWHALATWVGRLAITGRALLIDIGSTTSDLIPLWQGRPCSRGTTDCTRLLAGELVYTGVRRTPVCALPGDVSLLGSTLRPAAELFATTLDVWLLLGEIAESELDCDTANGRPATRFAAIDRLARSFCCDRTELSAEDLLSVARQLAEAQEGQLVRALERVTAENPGIYLSVIVSGSGSFLARRVIAKNSATASARIVSLDAHLTPEIAAAAPACAVAVLAHEEIHADFRRDLLPGSGKQAQ